MAIANRPAVRKRGKQTRETNTFDDSGVLYVNNRYVYVCIEIWEWSVGFVCVCRSCDKLACNSSSFRVNKNES